MELRILIAYVSGYGSTAEVAQEMGKHLTEGGISVTVSPLPHIDNLAQYDAVIIGGAIRYDRWMPVAREFVKKHESHLAKIPVAYFFNCLALARRTEETENKANQYAHQLMALTDQVKPLSIGRFAGVLDYTKMPFFLRMIFKVFGSIVGLQEGDYRDWQAIHQWTKDVEVQFVEVLKEN